MFQIQPVDMQWYATYLQNIIPETVRSKIHNTSSAPLTEDDWHKVALAFSQIRPSSLIQLAFVLGLNPDITMSMPMSLDMDIEKYLINLANAWISRYIQFETTPTMMFLAQDLAGLGFYREVEQVYQLFPLYEHRTEFSAMLRQEPFSKDNFSKLLYLLSSDPVISSPDLLRVFGKYLGLKLKDFPEELDERGLVEILIKRDLSLEDKDRLNWVRVATAFDKMRANVSVQFICCHYNVKLIDTANLVKSSDRSSTNEESVVEHVDLPSEFKVFLNKKMDHWFQSSSSDVQLQRKASTEQTSHEEEAGDGYRTHGRELPAVKSAWQETYSKGAAVSSLSPGVNPAFVSDESEMDTAFTFPQQHTTLRQSTHLSSHQVNSSYSQKGAGLKDVQPALPLPRRCEEDRGGCSSAYPVDKTAFCQSLPEPKPPNTAGEVAVEKAVQSQSEAVPFAPRNTKLMRTEWRPASAKKKSGLKRLGERFTTNWSMPYDIAKIARVKQDATEPNRFDK